MNFMSRSQTPAEYPAASLSVERILATPDLFPILQAGARNMVALYDPFPRIARLVAAHQKWLLSQIAFALYLDRDPSIPTSGITASRLLDVIETCGGASRNTATAFLAEMLAYKLIRDVPGHVGRRTRPLEPTETSLNALLLWFGGQMRTLDQFDGGNRSVILETAPMALVTRAQPHAVRSLVNNPAWREPPTSVASFVWTELGGLILDDVITRITDLSPVDGLYRVESLRLSDLSDRYGISRTHIRRMFNRAQIHGFVGRDEETRGSWWLSGTLLADYARWQAVKFAALAEGFAYAQACLSAPAEAAE